MSLAHRVIDSSLMCVCVDVSVFVRISLSHRAMDSSLIFARDPGHT